MAAPTPNWDLVTLRGKYKDFAGNAVTGRIIITPVADRAVDQAAVTLVIGLPIAVDLDNTGQFSIDLPATDDPDITPVNFNYLIKEEFNLGKSYYIPLPRHVGGYDLATIAPLEDPDTGELTLQGPAGPAGPAGPTGRGVSSIARTSGTGAPGATDTYTITFTDATTSTFTITNGTNGTNGSNGAAGRGITSIARTSGSGTAGSTDTYTITYSDSTTSTFTVVNGANGAGAGDVVGPASSVTGRLASFNGTTGKLLQDSGKLISDFAAASHTHVKANITDLGTIGTAAALNVPASGNAASGEVVKGSDTRLTDSRTPTTHTHAESDVTNLVTDLGNKLAKASNLSDVANVATARTNLGLGGAATQNVGTTTGTVAAGDDSRIASAASKKNGGLETVTATATTTGTINLDLSQASIFTVNCTGNIAISLSNPTGSSTAAMIATLIVSQNATVRTVTLPTGGVWIGSAPTQVANKRCIITMMSVDGGTTWLCSGAVEA